MTASGRIEVGLGLGSNIGDKAGHIRETALRLAREGIVAHAAMSALYRTAPWGNLDQDWFVNACLVGETALTPLALLARLKALEVEVGRTATVRWGPRVIDIDILYYGAVALDTPALTLPHRDIANRAFVLVPLAELRPGLQLGDLSVAEHLARLGDQGVARLEAGADG